MRRTTALAAALAAAVLLLCAPPATAGSTATAPHVEMTYEGLDEAQAKAVVDTMSAAWTVYVEDFGADMPEKVIGTAVVEKGRKTQLYTDCVDRFFLYLADKRLLLPPAKTGVFNLYGMCHELGHMAMRRVLKDDYVMLTDSAREGWAHSAGSVVVDAVWAAKGEKLWFEPYDYGKDGTPRLDRALAAKKPSAVNVAAGEWRKLDAIVGRKGLRTLFAQWQTDQPRDAPAILASAVRAFPAQKDALTAWWTADVAKLFVEPPPGVSGEPVVTAEKSELAGEPKELKGDDGTAEDKRSIAGGGHARRFEADKAGEWFLTKVSVHGARYGPPKAPETKFDLALCDVEMKVIARWSFPYAVFKYGPEEWAAFEIPPTRVPAKGFFVCLDFNPTASNGVYVSIDTSTKGASQNATPGKAGGPLQQGDWMIRATVDRRVDAASLGGRK